MKIALTIAGSDPTGGAGLQVDLKTFRCMGVYGLSVPTVMTVQNTTGVYEVHELPIDFFIRQIDMLLGDITPDAIKTGMIYSSEIIGVVVEKIKGYSLKNLVVDPVTVSSTGTPLIKEGTLEVMRDYLFPVAEVITPNIYEASLLTGIDIHSEEDMKESAKRLMEFGPSSVVVTGGHLHHTAVDLLFDGSEFIFLEKEAVDGEYHGTGCVFSAVITASLARGYKVREAFVKAKEFVHETIRSARAIGKGMKVLDV